MLFAAVRHYLGQARPSAHELVSQPGLRRAHAESSAAGAAFLRTEI